ncbi:outer membrane biogenesis protein BamB [Rosistilla carotiformis]|uniref:Outer membrane biogenesis protein BamB n=1 Tax=Rosistilla carotiformis TaxID=2528017 RepID=A0A518JPA1_9BACT|nr:PQQ-binding-like beta-propeller repeat protein [Rosistilla carotiformis]QDV67372.1 outer membrane biogenesis protein BamB [Rosistilla carotiformis]
MMNVRVASLIAATLLAASQGGCKRAPEKVVSELPEIKDVPIVELPHTAAWGSFRGPGMEGHAPDQPLPTSWGEDQNVLWARDLPGLGHASPILVDNMVVLPTAMEEQERQLVIAYDRSDGRELWSRVIHEGNFVDESQLHQKSSQANSTLACNGKQIFAVFLNDAKVVLSALGLDGTLLWQTDVSKFQSRNGFGASPVLYKSLVICPTDNNGGGNIVAIDGASGEVVWRTDRGAHNTYSSANVCFFGEDRDAQLLISGGEGITSYAPETGKINWVAHSECDVTCGTMICGGDYTFASGGVPGNETICLDRLGTTIWTNQVKVYEPSLLYVEGYLYAVTDNGIAYCWEASTGEECWRKRLGKNFSASPWTCNGLIYVTNVVGDTTVFEANPDEFKEVAKNHLGTDCFASPAIDDSRIYMRVGVEGENGRQERLYCLGDES